MNIFLAGATGAIGSRLVPILIASGHRVVGMTRTESKTQELRSLGAEPVVADALDRNAVMNAVEAARPDVVVHEGTALANVHNLKNFDQEFALTNRLRTEGTDNLMMAAQASGAKRFVAQSYAGWPSARTGGPVKTEEDPLEPDPPPTMKRSLAAIRQLEQMVVGAAGMTGIVLRYGPLYGPGTSLTETGEMTNMVRKRQLPVIGTGAGVWSFIHVDDAAEATRLAIEHGPGGLYNIVDDEPAAVSTWLPDLANALGAKPPFHLPRWIGRLAVGEAVVLMMTEARGSSNAKAKRVLGWKLVYPSWRDGFRRGLAPRDAASAQTRETVQGRALY